ncbi:hypothetical protein [Peterkaempfera sp. SMS 1(5)a]|uniref:hypothetical protein n=1 Tax=Peterkaempfera podocarpi TaxID=3232308 RepID=UPI0036717D88
MGDGHHHDRPQGGPAVLTAPARTAAPAGTGGRRPRAVLGLDVGAADLRAADAVLQSLAGLPAEALACTQPIHGEHPHVALTVEVPDRESAAVWALLCAAADAVPGGGASWGYRRHGAAPAAEAAGAAAAAHALGRGRAVRFPGVGALTGTVTVGELLARSAIDRVALLGGGTADSAAQVATRGRVRPERRTGELVLVVEESAHGQLTPYEVPGPFDRRIVRG